MTKWNKVEKATDDLMATMERAVHEAEKATLWGVPEEFRQKYFSVLDTMHGFNQEINEWLTDSTREVWATINTYDGNVEAYNLDFDKAVSCVDGRYIAVIPTNGLVMRLLEEDQGNTV